MLLRTFRLTDKLITAFLRTLAWAGMQVIQQLYQIRLALFKVATLTADRMGNTARTGRAIYSTNTESRRAMMAKRAAELSTRTVVREDPLKTQNRALSLFTVVLMLALIGVVLWFTSQNTIRPQPPVVGGGPLILPTRIPSTATDSPIPTATLAPDPLQTSGSVVFSLHENGRDNLWAFTIGHGNPIRITNSGTDRDPSFSPDGTRVAYVSKREGSWEVYILNLTSGENKRLTFSPAYKASPSWSPDGAFVAYEAYEDNNLDIYLVAVDGSSQPNRLTVDPAPDFSPAWGPGLGRKLAYTSLRNGSADIYVIDLNDVRPDGGLRLTTDLTDEDFPRWNPDGTMIAYSTLINGTEFVSTKHIDQPQDAGIPIGQGREPTWAPDGRSLLFMLDNGPLTLLVGGQVENSGVSATAVNLNGRAHHPSWVQQSLPDTLLVSKGVPFEHTLYTETSDQPHTEPPFYQSRPVEGVEAPIAILSDRVDDSFKALRQEANQDIGYDFLGKLADMLWDNNRVPEIGQTRQNWHYAGRAFAFDRNLVFNNPPLVEVVREEIGVNTYWRIYVRVAENMQQGQLGEPLKRIPWDMNSRSSGDPTAFEQGGKPKFAVPNGYYVDFTALAEDYGWTRVPSEQQWRSNFPSLLYWTYEKRDNLTWEQAMLEIFTRDELQTFLSGPTPLPTRRPTASPTPEPKRTATPVPPA